MGTDAAVMERNIFVGETYIALLSGKRKVVQVTMRTRANHILQEALQLVCSELAVHEYYSEDDFQIVWGVDLFWNGEEFIGMCGNDWLADLVEPLDGSKGFHILIRQPHREWICTTCNARWDGQSRWEWNNYRFTWTCNGCSFIIHEDLLHFPEDCRRFPRPR